MAPSITLYVNASGEPGFYNSISAALAAAAADYAGEAEVAIEIAAGDYFENLTIARSGISLIGANSAHSAASEDRGAETLINGYILVTGGDTALSGLKIQPGGSIWTEKVGVMIAAADVSISNTVFEGTGYPDGYRGIMTAANQATGLSVTGSSFDALYTGIYINPGVTGLSVTGNSFTANGNGMVIDGPNVTGDVSSNSFVNSAGSHIGMGSWTSGTIDAGAVVGENSFTGTSTPTSIWGTAGADVITGTGAANKLYGEGGDDLIHAGAGDSVYGGAGTDTVVLSEDITAGQALAMVLDGVELARIAGTGATTWVVAAGMSIQAAIDAAAAGDTIVLGDGVFTENVLINKAGITLTSLNGRGATTIDGSDASPRQGTIEIAPGTNGVTISGLTILGVNGNGSSEKAAVNIIGANTGLTLLDNEIVARGDGALLSQYGFGVRDAVISGNIFSGKTFVGDQPESSAANTSAGQFNPGSNFPRPLVFLGTNGADDSTNLTFTNNILSGTAGGISSVTGLPYGNNLLNVDIPDSTITGNTFTGSNGGFTAALRSRRDGTVIEDNTFDLSEGGNFSFPASIIVLNNPNGELGVNRFIAADGTEVFLGTAGNDVITGTDADEIFHAGAGNDTIDGAGGTDTLDMSGAGPAGAFVDLASGLAFSTATGIDTVANIENVTGSAGNDGLFGDAGDNLFTASGGSDMIDGREGTDSYDASGMATAMTVDLAAGTAQKGAQADTLVSIENVATGAGDDAVTGSAAANVISTGAGNDTITASAGSDVIDGGSGTDTVSYGTAAAAIAQGTGSSWEITAGGDTQTLSNVEIVTDASGRTLLVGNGGFADIAAALAVAGAGDTILVAEGTYAGGFTITQEGLTIKAAGEVVIQGTFRTDNGLDATQSIAEWLQGNTPAGASLSSAPGISVAADGVTLEGLTLKDFWQGIRVTASLEDLVLRDVHAGGGGNGLSKTYDSSIAGLTVSGGSFSDMEQGIMLEISSGQRMSDIVVDGTGFSNLNQKGIYLESGDGLLLTNLTMEEVGQYGRSPYFASFPGDEGAVGTGIDINLKYSGGDPYENITISDSSFTNTGMSDLGGAGTSHAGGAAISIKARDDGGYASDPAEVNGAVKIENVTIDGTSVGIRAGEPGRANAGPAVEVTGTSVTNAAGAEIDNVTGATLKVTLGDDGETWAAAATTTGAIDFTGGAGNDDMTGGAGADSFAGGGGNDAVDGGAGLDTVVFAGDAADYTITWDGTTAVVSDGTSTVTITNAGRLDFADRDVLLVAAGGEFATIQSAVDAAADGDEVLIADGLYAEDIGIHGKSVTLTGAQAAAPVPMALDLPAPAGVTIAGQISTSGLMGADDVLRFANLTIDAAGRQYGLYMLNSAADVPGVNGGTIALDTVTVRNAAAQGLFYAHPDNGANPLDPDTVGTVSILNSVFEMNGEVWSGARGHGHVNLFGFNGNLTVEGTSFTSSDALGISNFRGGSVGSAGPVSADKALSVSGIRTGTKGEGGYPGAGELVLKDITVDGKFSSDVLSFYDIGSFAGITIEGVTVTAEALWALVNFDSVSGPIDLSGVTGTNTGPGRISELQGLATDDRLTGTDGADLLFGRGGADTLLGGDGDDLFVYATPAQFAEGESIDGGAGTDTVLFTGTGTLVLGAGITGVEQAAVTNAGGAGLDASALTDGITLQGGAGNDTLTGGAGADTILGGDGDDLVVYAGGTLAAADEIDGGSGSDTISFTGSEGTLVLGSAVAGIEAVLTGTSGDTGIDASASASGLWIGGGAGNNTLTGSAHADTIAGGAGDDLLDGGEGNDLLEGGAGGDTLTGGAGDDTLDGGEGFDTADYSAATAGVFANLLLGTAFGTGIGNDTLTGIEALKGGSGNDALVAGNGGHLLDGGAGDDTLTGGTGNDTLVAGAGNDAVHGGGGTDTVVLAGNWADYTITQSGGVTTLANGLNTVTVTGTELFEFDDVTVALEDLANQAPDDITFGNGTPTVTENEAGAVITTIAATDPNPGDTLVLTVDDARFEIVWNMDLAVHELKLKDSESLDREAASTVTVTITATDNGGLSRSEELVIGVLDVNEGPVVTYPGLGIWEVEVEAGAIGAALGARPDVDDPEGDPLTYQLVSGPLAGRLLVNGEEVISGWPLTQAEFDAMVFETTEAGGVYTAQFLVTDGQFVTTLDAQFTVTADVNSDLTGTKWADTLDGASGNDIVRGQAGADVLYGGSGRDTLLGAGGHDLLVGGSGRDSLYGGDGNDTIEGGADNDRLLGGAGNDLLDGGDGNDFADGGDGADTLTGGNGNDTLMGGLNADVLFGGAGNDVLDGGQGFDTLYGGGGADTFVLSVAADNYGSAPRLHIADFEQGIDRIDLSAYGLTFIGKNLFSGSATGEVRYSGGTSDALTIDFDGNGTGDYRIQLYSGVLLTAADLIL